MPKSKVSRWPDLPGRPCLPTSHLAIPTLPPFLPGSMTSELSVIRSSLEGLTPPGCTPSLPVHLSISKPCDCA